MSQEINVGTVTACLHQASAGDQMARSRAFQVLETQLRRIAESLLHGEDTPLTLQASCLVHDAFLKLINAKHVRWSNRRHFLSYAAEAMRQILVDHARGRKAQKRGYGVRPVSLADGPEPADAGPSPVTNLENHEKVLAVDRALSLLAESHRDLAIVVILKFFGGYSLTEIAVILEVSVSTAKSRLAQAKILLSRRLRQVGGGDWLPHEFTP